MEDKASAPRRSSRLGMGSNADLPLGAAPQQPPPDMPATFAAQDVPPRQVGSMISPALSLPRPTRRGKRRATDAGAKDVSSDSADCDSLEPASGRRRQLAHVSQAVGSPTPPKKPIVPNSKRHKKTADTATSTSTNAGPSASRSKRLTRQDNCITPSPMVTLTTLVAKRVHPSLLSTAPLPREGTVVQTALKQEAASSQGGDSKEIEDSSEKEAELATVHQPRDLASMQNLRAPPGVIDLDALAGYHLSLRNAPPPLHPVEPFKNDVDNSFLSSYGRNYYSHIANVAEAHQRAMTNAQPFCQLSDSGAALCATPPARGTRGRKAVTSSPPTTDGSSSKLMATSGKSSVTSLPANLRIQSEISYVMRGILVDWLVELKHSFRLNCSTLHLSVKLLDRILCDMDVKRKNFQCLGCACMLIASKLEETQLVTTKDLAYMSDSTYTRSEIKDMEVKICDLLEFRLQTPTAYQFVDRFLRASDATAGQAGPSPRSPTLETLVSYLLELSLLDASFVETPADLMAASAVYLARATLGIRDAHRQIWNTTLIHYTSLEASDLKETVLRLHCCQVNAEDSDLKCVLAPYKTKEKYRVASIPAILPCDLGFD